MSFSSVGATASARHHTIDYVELAAPDLPTATAFYGSAFGWRFHDYGGAYAGIVGPDGEGEVGGLNPGSAPSPDGVLVLLWSDDLEASASAVTTAGGTITVPIFAFPGGRRFHFADPAGNQLGCWGE